MPMSTRVAAARLDAYPSWHMTMTGPVRATTSGSSQPDVGSTRHSMMFRDMTIAPGMTPCSWRCSYVRVSRMTRAAGLGVVRLRGRHAPEAGPGGIEQVVDPPHGSEP